MDLTIQQGDLAFAAGRALGSVSAKSPLPLLSCLLLEADKTGLTVTGTDLEVTTSAQVPCEVKTAGRVAVSARHFHEVVRKMPKGPVTTISTSKGSLVSVALPSRAAKSWRLARAVNANVLVEVNEANVGSNIVVIYRATGRGSVKVAYGLTRGESAKAFASATFNVRVS